MGSPLQWLKMIEMVVARVTQCSKIQKPSKRHNDASEALCQHLLETFFHGFPQKVEVMLLYLRVA